VSIAFTKVKLPYGWLGNMAPFSISFGGVVWRTSEALFQARRFADSDPIRKLIQQQESPMAAKMLAKAHRSSMVIAPQSAEDLALMADVLRLKIEAHPRLREALLATGDEEIIEDCTARQYGSGLFWGAARRAGGSWFGENHLGRLWMSLRTVLTTESA